MSVWVLYGDSYMDIDYAAVLERFEKSGALALMTVLRNENRWDKSNVVFEKGRLLRYDKKTQTADMCHIDYGVALVTREALPAHTARQALRSGRSLFRSGRRGPHGGI